MFMPYIGSIAISLKQTKICAFIDKSLKQLYIDINMFHLYSKVSTLSMRTGPSLGKASTPGSMDVSETEEGRTPKQDAIISQDSFLHDNTNECLLPSGVSIRVIVLLLWLIN
jgi:hypothetical protein